MARLFWVAVGAAGGVYAYRKGERAVEAVRERGVAGTAQLIASGALHALAGGESPVSAAPGITVAGLRITRAAQAPSAPIVDTGVVDIRDARGNRRDLQRTHPRRKAT